MNKGIFTPVELVAIILPLYVIALVAVYILFAPKSINFAADYCNAVAPFNGNCTYLNKTACIENVCEYAFNVTDVPFEMIITCSNERCWVKG